MGDIIRKETPFGEVLEIFKKRDFVMPFMGEFVLYGLLQDCDYIEVMGYGQQLQLKLVREEPEDEQRNKGRS